MPHVEREPRWHAFALQSRKNANPWRRRLVLALLDAVYPRWISAAEMARLCAHVRGDRAELRRPAADNTARTLSRLHEYRLVECYGERGTLAGRTSHKNPKVGWLRKPGRRYRLVKRAEDLL